MLDEATLKDLKERYAACSAEELKDELFTLRREGRIDRAGYEDERDIAKSLAVQEQIEDILCDLLASKRATLQ